jgi:hypothetical protein
MESIEALAERWHLIFRTLTAGPRRQILGSLLEVPPDRSLSLPEAANMPDYRIDPETLRQELVHRHLPLMAKAGFVEWERDPFEVRRGPAFDDVAAVLLAIVDYDDFPEHSIQGCYFFERSEVNR